MEYNDLQQYVEAEILPRYDSFDKAHRRPHAERVIRDALALAAFYPVDRDMVYAAAAFHDTGLCGDRATHHLVSGRIIREDPVLPRWFSPEQIETVAQAAEDHRASLDHAPRSIYGRIIAEADRQIEPETIVRRTVQFGLAHYPSADRETHWQRTLEHLHEKYAAGGSSSDLFPNENSLFFPYNKRELKKVNADGVVIPQNPYYLNGEEDD